MGLPLPTRRGAGTVAAAAGALVAGIGVGIRELDGLAAGLLCLAVCCAGWTATRRLDIGDAHRRLPARLEVGDEPQVVLSVRNTGSEPSPALVLHDGPAAPHVQLAALRAGREAVVAYRMALARRGRVRVGPLTAEVLDPLGLTCRRRVLADPVELLVRPAVEPIHRQPPAAESERVGIPDPHQGMETGEFAGLREYRPGDDVRRIHWSSSARRDVVLVREDERQHVARLTVSLDLRAATWDVPAGGSTAALETAVSAAASLLADGAERGHQVRLCTTGGLDTGYGTGLRHRGRLLDELALVAVHAGPAQEPAANSVRRGAVVAVTSDRPAPGLPPLGNRRGVTTVAVSRRPAPPAGTDAPQDADVAHAGSDRRVQVPLGRSFAAAWDGARLR